MDQPTGKRLQQARLGLGLSLEDVQHLTRIRLAQLVGMENDDLTVFSSPSYARGFYTLYGRFLGVDLTEFLAVMEPGRLKAVKDHQYLRPSTDRVTPHRRVRAKAQQPLPQAGRLALLGTALVLVIGAAAWFGNLQWSHAAPTEGNARTSVDPVATNLPLLAGTGPATSPEPPSGDPEITLAKTSTETLSTSSDVRSTPPPVLKALPVDDAANSRRKPNTAASKNRNTGREVRRPTPFTR